MEDTILFPFDYRNDNKSNFVETMQLAELNNQKVILFTCIEEGNYEEELDKIYMHILKLYGHFQSWCYGWRKIEVPVEKVIMKGNFRKNFTNFLKENKIAKNQKSHLPGNYSQMQNLMEGFAVPPNLIIN